MGKGILKKKRTRLVALLAALCAFLAVGIGAGAAAASRAETPSLKLGKGVQTAQKAVLSSSSALQSGPLAFCQGDNSSSYSYCQQLNTDGFNSSAQVNYLAYAPSQGQYTGWAGNNIVASVTLGAGAQMPIALPIGLWNGSTFVNPNTLSPKTLEEYMLDGDYMGNIGVVSQYAGDAWYSFLGGVEYNGELDTSMNTFVQNNSSTISGDMLDDSINNKQITLQPESMQYRFQYDCNNSDILSNPYFAKMASLSTSQLAAVLDELLFGPQGLYTTDEEFYGQGESASSSVGKMLASLKSEGQNLESTATVEEYQKGFEAYAAAIKAGKSAADARQAYLDAIEGTDASTDQPLLCLAAWDQNVGYSSFPSEEVPYTQGSDVAGNMGDAFNGASSGTYSYAYWGAGPSYIGTGTASDSTLAMTVSSTATDFLESVLGSSANSNGIQLTAIYYPGQASSFYSPSGDGVSVDIEPVKNSSGQVVLKGMGQYVSFRSLGLTPDSVNPTALPSGDTLSTSSPSSYGLYFKAVSQSGEPLKSVKMELEPDDNSSYVQNWHWNGWQQTPIAPATNSAPNGVTSSVWPNVNDTYWAGYYHYVPFTANSLSSQPGWFDFSGVAPGVYDVVILSGTTESGEQVSYGSYYNTGASTFQIDASSYSSPEKISAVADLCGFVDPSQDEVVVGAENPSSSITQGAVAPKSGTSDPYTATVGSSNPFTYQAEAYLPFSLSSKNASGDAASSVPVSFSLSSLPQGEQIVSSSVEVNGIPLSTLGSSLTSSSSGFSFSLSPSQISTLQSSGFEPYPNQADKLTSSSGQVDRALAVTWKAYLDSSFTSPGSPEYAFKYEAYSSSPFVGGKEDLEPVSTNGPADNSVPSSLDTSADSSSTGLWFKDLNPDGSASSGAKFMVQNSSGDYLEEDTSSGAFTGWSWTSTPSASTEFSQKNADAVFSFGGLENGTYTVIQVAWPSSMGTSAAEGSGENNWPGISPDLKAGGPDWAGYPGHLGGKTGYDGSFQVVLSYSSPESMSTQADPAGLVDASSDQIYSLSPIKMAPIVNSSLSSQAYQTETVGVPFTEGWEGYLPMANTSPTSAGGTYYSSSMQVAINENVNGLEMLNPSTSNIEVASIPLSTLVENGALATSGASPASSSDTVYTITLPYKALQYIEENGKNAEGQPLSSSSNRLIVISFPAKMETSFKEGGTFQQWMALGGITVSNSQADTSNAWWTQNPGSDWYVSSSPLYTNGTSDNSLPSSLSMSSPSSSTGLWFKSLWWGTSNPATGAKFTVSQTQGGKTVYLTPEETSGKFSGWSWQDSPYDFSEQNSDADFSFGGLANGTYTVTEVDPATGATSSSLSFTGALSYSSPEALTSVSDPLNLLSPKEGIVYNVVVPSHLPFTGGRWVLILSAAAVLLFGAGAAFFLLRKRRA